MASSGRSNFQKKAPPTLEAERKHEKDEFAKEGFLYDPKIAD